MQSIRPKWGWAVFAALALTIPAIAQSHTTISPRQSMHGATVKYTIRIPTEGDVATTGAELDVPEGVIVESLQVPVGWEYDVERADDRIVSITWRADIQPGEFLEVGFVARNPRQGSEIVWILRQNFADGTVTDWTNGPNGIRLTAVTQLAPRTQ